MTTTELLIWWGLMFVGIVGSALFSGLETGIYSLNRVRLHLQADRGKSSARLLQELVQRPNKLLATLLIGTNIANNIATSATGVLLESTGMKLWQLIVANVLIVTPLLFVFAETLPKDLFAFNADRLVYPFARLIRWMSRLFTWLGVIPLITVVSRLAMRAMNVQGNPAVFHPRRQVQALVKEGLGHGLLTDNQSAIIERVLNLSKRRLRHEMIPWKKVSKIQLTDAPQSLWQLAAETSLSRFPVLDGQGHVVGVIDLYHVLLEHQCDDCPPIAEIMEPPTLMDADTSLRDGLVHMREGEQHDALAIVMENQQPVGVVTIKDLVEPITGELYSW